MIDVIVAERTVYLAVPSTALIDEQVRGSAKFLVYAFYANLAIILYR